MQYRKDIDGLRALAILPVIFFHFKFETFSGGYIGVDIFFVISGYLITKILIQNYFETNTISIVKFYERRFRRIMPALIAVIIVTTILSMLIMTPHDLVKYGLSITSTTLFFANIFFWKQSGSYFDDEVELMPLLHNWSLSVEEQFYIFLPVLIYYCVKNKNFKIIYIIFIASLAVSIYGVREMEKATFYLLPTRSWELLTGTIIAINEKKLVTSKNSGKIFFIGLLFITTSILFYDKNTLFPGDGAILPCAGAALIIISGIADATQKTKINSIIENSLMVWTGKISYSLYLWHWPIISLFMYKYGEPTQFEKIFLIILTLILSLASYILIENRFRNSAPEESSKKILANYIFLICATSAGGMLIYSSDGIPQRLEESSIQISRESESNKKLVSELSADKNKYNADYIIGSHKSKSTEPDYIIWGDSHAASLFAGSTLKNELKNNYKILSMPGCFPLKNVYIKNEKNSYCRQFNNDVINYINSRGIKNVILIGRWGSIINNKENSKNQNLHSSPGITNSNNEPLSQNEAQNLLANLLIETVTAISTEKTKIYIHEPIIESNVDVPRLLIAKKPEERGAVTFSYADYSERYTKFNSIIHSIKDKNFTIIKNPNINCNNQMKCKIFEDNKINYFDDDHISATLALRMLYNFESLYITDKAAGHRSMSR